MTKGNAVTRPGKCPARDGRVRLSWGQISFFTTILGAIIAAALATSADLATLKANAIATRRGMQLLVNIPQRVQAIEEWRIAHEKAGESRVRNLADNRQVHRADGP